MSPTLLKHLRALKMLAKQALVGRDKIVREHLLPQGVIRRMSSKERHCLESICATIPGVRLSLLGRFWNVLRRRRRGCN